MIDLGSLVAKIKVEDGDAISKLTKFGNTSTTTGAKVKKGMKIAAAAFVAVGAAAVMLGKKIKSMTDEVAKNGDEIDKQSQKMGISAKGYQEWGYILDRNGASINSLKVGMKTMAAQMEKGSSAFDKLGVKVKDSSGNFREQEDVLNDSMTALAGVKDKTERLALANEIFGKRTAQELLPTLNSGAEGIDDLKNRAEELGFVMSDDTVKACADYEDAMTDVQMSVQGLKNNLVAGLIPGMAEAASKLSDFIGDASVTLHKEIEKNGAAGVVTAIGKIAAKAIQALVNKLPSLIQALADGITRLADSLASGDNTGKFISSLGKIVEAIIKVTPQLIAAGIKLIGALFAGMIQAFANIPGWVKKKCEDIKKKFGDISLKKIGKDIIGSLKDGFVAKWQALKTWVNDKVTWIKNKFKNAKASANSGSGHRIGLREVPYDGYAATLHKGETVLTAAESNQLSNVLTRASNSLMTGMASMGAVNSASSGPSEIKLVINLGGAKVAEQIYKLNKQGQLALQG